MVLQGHSLALQMQAEALRSNASLYPQLSFKQLEENKGRKGKEGKEEENGERDGRDWAR